MPRILFLDHAGVLGGAELSLLTIARHYAGSGRVILFADGPFRERLERDGLAVEILRAPESVSGARRGGGGLHQMLAFPGVVQMAREIALRAKNFDVLLANSQKALVVGALASKMAGKPLIWCLRDILTADHFSGFNRKAVVFLANRFANRIVANSQATLAAFVASGGRTQRTRVVYNGIDIPPDPTREIATAAREIRNNLGWDGAKVVGLFSRLAPWKGQHVLLEALPKVPELYALFVGAPLFGDEVLYQQELEAKAASLGLGDRVRFLGFREDIPALLEAVDFVAHTSVAPEPFGRVIVEGMLAGKPVIATRAGGACEIIEDGITGRLVTPGDADALAKALRALIEQPNEAARLARAGRASAHERFSVKAMLLGIEQAVAEAMEGR